MDFELCWLFLDVLKGMVGGLVAGFLVLNFGKKSAYCNKGLFTNLLSGKCLSGHFIFIDEHDIN